MVSQSTGPTTTLPISRLAFKPASNSNNPSTSNASNNNLKDSSDLLIGYGGAWLTPPHPTSINHSIHTTSRPHAPGLQNLGNTCFLNAALQCLLHCVPLQLRLLKGGRHANAAHTHPRFCAFCALQTLANGLYSDSPPRVIAPRAFAANAKSVCSTFRPGRQEDAHEFVRALLEGMTKAEIFGCSGGAARGAVIPIQKEINADVHWLFGGVLQSSITCHHCSHSSHVTEPFLDLSLEIARVSSVQRALAKFTAPEVLQGDNRYRCEACKKLVVASKRYAVRRAPNVLTLHLKRFDRSRKDSRLIQYTENLDLSPHMYGKPEDAQAKYVLNAVLIHQGTSRQYGHYYAYVKGNNNTWCLKDDSTSRAVSLSTVLKQKAYLLFYTRVVDTKKTKNVTNNQKNVKPNQQPMKKTPTKQKITATPPFDPPSSQSPSRDVLEVVPESIKSLANGQSHLNESLIVSRQNGKEEQADLSLSEESESDDESYSPTNESEEESGDDESDLDTDEDTEEQHTSNRPSATTSSPVVRAPSAPFRAPSTPSRNVQKPKEAQNANVSVQKQDNQNIAQKFLGPVGYRAEAKTTKLESEPNKDSEDDTEPSEPNSSADDEEMNNGSGAVRAILIGGGDAVRKVIRRVFGVQNPPKNDRKRSIQSSTPAPSPATRTIKENTKEIRSTKTNVVNNKPDPLPATTNHDSSTVPQQSVKETTIPENSSTLFSGEGVARWDDVMNDNVDTGSNRSFSRSKIVKRRRANDVLDAEYDTGKQKKARNRYSTSPTTGPRQRIMFDQIAERRRKQKGKNDLKDRSADNRKNQGG